MEDHGQISYENAYNFIQNLSPDVNKRHLKNFIRVRIIRIEFVLFSIIDLVNKRGLGQGYKSFFASSVDFRWPSFGLLWRNSLELIGSSFLFFELICLMGSLYNVCVLGLLTICSSNRMLVTFLSIVDLRYTLLLSLTIFEIKSKVQQLQGSN